MTNPPFRDLIVMNINMEDKSVIAVLKHMVAVYCLLPVGFAMTILYGLLSTLYVHYFVFGAIATCHL